MERGDPRATAAAILQVIDAKEPPLRFLVGSVLLWVTATYDARLETWRAWNKLARSAQSVR
jgi:hypothetical protein